MLQLFYIISYLIVLTVGNPFHKYPFVFLLDVGNEELEGTNTEQIRIAAPGGSIAVRYPAIGNGAIIAHVRVSGIDFGTDLKADIIDGGPGYNYVVLVFMGNPGVPYDAVMTVQTLPDGSTNDYSVIHDPNAYSNGIDESKRADDNLDNTDYTVDDAEGNFKYKLQKRRPQSNGDVLQSEPSSDTYTFDGHKDLDTNSHVSEGDGDDNDKELDIHVQNAEKFDSHDYAEDYQNAQQTNADKSADSYSDDTPTAERYSANDGYNEQPVGYVDNNLYSKYQALKPHLYEDIYPQKASASEEEESSRAEASESEDPVELDQMFNDEEVHNDAIKFKDANNNNNYFDSDDSSAVES